MPGCWWSDWGLIRDPFQGDSGPFISTTTHDEALARIRYAIEMNLKRASLRGTGGAGKSRLISYALERYRHPTLRLVSVKAGYDGVSTAGSIARAFRQASRTVGHSTPWDTIRKGAELCRLQSLRLVIAVDGELSQSETQDFWSRLESAAEAATLFQIARGEHDEDGWDLSAELSPLNYSEVTRYVESKLRASGRTQPTFTDKALVALHSVSSGNPRRIEQIASLAMMATAAEGRALVDRPIVDSLSAPGLVA